MIINKLLAISTAEVYIKRRILSNKIDDILENRPRNFLSAMRRVENKLIKSAKAGELYSVFKHPWLSIAFSETIVLAVATDLCDKGYTVSLSDIRLKVSWRRKFSRTDYSPRQARQEIRGLSRKNGKWYGTSINFSKIYSEMLDEC